MLALPVECPSCSHGNPAGSRYCNECGMPVNFRWCAQCDAVNHGGATHCRKCGTVLGTPVDVMPPFATQSPAPPRVEEPALPDVAADIAAPLPATLEPAAVLEAPPATKVEEEVPRRRRVSLRLVLTAALLVGLAVPAYLAHQDRSPAPPLVKADSAVAMPAAEAPMATVAEPPPAPAAEAAEPQPPAAAPEPAPVPSARQSASRSKQGSGARKGTTAKGSDARTRSKSRASASTP